MNDCTKEPMQVLGTCAANVATAFGTSRQTVSDAWVEALTDVGVSDKRTGQFRKACNNA